MTSGLALVHIEIQPAPRILKKLRGMMDSAGTTHEIVQKEVGSHWRFNYLSPMASFMSEALLEEVEFFLRATFHCYSDYPLIEWERLERLAFVISRVEPQGEQQLSAERQWLVHLEPCFTIKSTGILMKVYIKLPERQEIFLVEE